MSTVSQNPTGPARLPGDLRGRIVLITGATAGAGLVTAIELAHRGAEIAFVARNRERAEAAVKQIAAAASGPKPRVFLADVANQSEVRGAAAEIRAAYDHIDVMINNAAGMFDTRELTVDGIERTWATNHLGAFLLTNLLLPLLLAAPSARIINVASEAYSRSLDFDNLQGEKKYNFMTAYLRSKAGTILFTNELARRLADSSVTVNAISPGPIKTSFGKLVTGVKGRIVRAMEHIPIMYSTPEKGARTYIYAATSPELDGVSGNFYLRSKKRRPKKVASDLDAARRLWTISVRQTGLRDEESMPTADGSTAAPRQSAR